MYRPYAIMLDLSGRTAVIVGGGPVAARKARGLLEAGAGAVRCISPAYCKQMPDAVERVRAPFAPEHLDGAGLVFAATDSPAVNDAVVAEAHRRGLWVNRADVAEDQPGDFTVPAVWCSKAAAGGTGGTGVTLAVSTAGSPALAARIRNDLAGKMNQGLVRMAAVMAELRPKIKAATADSRKRHEIFLELASNEAVWALTAGGQAALWRWLCERHPELADSSAGSSGQQENGHDGSH